MAAKHYRDIITLAAPIAGIQFAQVALTSTDLLMMGLLGLEAVAAGGLAMLLYNQLRTMCVGMVTSVGNMVAAAVGRGEKRTGTTAIDVAATEEVKDILRAAMLLATLSALAAGGLLILFGYFLTYLGQAQSVVELAKPIMLSLAPGLLPMVWLNVLRQFAVGMRRAGSLLMVTVISIAVNGLLNAAFIYGWLGIPMLGLAGIGLSTTLVQLWTFVVYLRMVGKDEKLQTLLAFDAWNANWQTVSKIAKMGIPISLTYGSEAAITSIATVLMGTFGPVALAASNVVNQLAYIVYQLNIGLSHGSSILVSRTLGKGDVDEIGKVAARTFTISFGIMTLIGMMYILLPDLVLRPFLSADADPSVTSLAAILLWFAIAHQFLKGSQNICIGLLRGLGNTKAGLINTLIGYWGVGIPCMFICGYLLGWGGQGVWFGLCLGFGVTSLLLWWHFLSALRGTTDRLQTLGAQG